MIGIFKNNLFFNSLLLLPYVVIIRIHSLLYPIAYTIQDSDTLMTKTIFGFLSSPLLQNIIAAILVFFQALYINRLVIQHRLANKITLLPGLLYALLVSILPEFSMLSPFLIVNTFILICINQIFKTYKRPKAADLLFNIGFLIAIASLIVPNYVVLILVGVIGLFVLRSMKVNEVLQMLSGVLLVFVGYCSILYLLNIEVVPELIKVNVIPRLVIFDVRGESFYKLVFAFGMSIFMVLNYAKYTLKKSIQTQKKIDILYWFMMASLIMVFLFTEINAFQVLLLLIPAAILLNNNFLNIKSILVQEIIHLIVLVLLFLFNFGVI